MSRQNQLHLLGIPKIMTAGEVKTAFRTRRILGLLAYLILEGKPIPRVTLAELFWHEKSESEGRKNLRWSLTQLRKLLPACWETNRESIAFVPAENWWVDVLAIQNALATNSYQEIVSFPSIEPLLQGFFLNNAPQFESWLLQQREHWRQMVRQTLLKLLEKETDPNQALPWAKKLIAQDSWQEDGHRWVMRLSAQKGDIVGALAQYEKCRQLLAKELGVEPEAETIALAKQISQPTFQPPNLPMPTTRFVGRKRELAQIVPQLQQADCRLLTIVGTGGIGKTQLALQTAHLLQSRYRDGAFFVPLENVYTETQLIQAIAQSVNFHFTTAENPTTQLHSFLQNKACLLLLDNFEQAISTSLQITQLLQNALQVNCLVTSRVRLQLQDEWLFSLEGLAVPDNEGVLEEVKDYESLQLFVQIAQRHQQGFRLSAENYQAVWHICRHLQGMPLGIELAAAMSRLISPQEILQQIKADQDVLQSVSQDMPARHSSLRAIFEQSWRLLSANEQDIFATLTIFRSGFTALAAKQVTNASISNLSSLLDNSILRHISTDRYEIHPLLRQYARDCLHQNEQMHLNAGNAHCAYFLQFLNQHPDPNTISIEIENLRAVWHWFTEQKPSLSPQIEQFVNQLGRFYEGQNWASDMQQLYEQALNLWQSNAGQSLCFAYWERKLAEAHFSLGRPLKSQHHLEQVLQQLGHPVPQTRGALFRKIGLALAKQGKQLWLPASTKPLPNHQQTKVREAVIALEKIATIYYFNSDTPGSVYGALVGLNLAEQLGSSPELARMYANVMVATSLIPIHRLARIYQQKALTTLSQFEDLYSQMWVQKMMAVYAIGIGDWQTTQKALDIASATAKQLQNHRQLEECLLIQATAAQYQGQFQQALDCWISIGQTALRRGDAQVQSWAVIAGAENLLHLNRPKEAETMLSQLESLLSQRAGRESTGDVSREGFLAQYFLHRGEYEKALKHANQTAEIIDRSSPTSFVLLEGYAGMTETFLTLWERHDELGVGEKSVLWDAGKKACTAFQKYASVFPIIQPRNYLWQGMLKWLQGNPNRAEKYWRQGLELAQQLQMPYDTALLKALSHQRAT